MGGTRVWDSGFTLVELMVVVLIIGVLLSIAVPLFQQSAADARAKSCQANQRTISGAIDLYRSIGDGVQTSTGGEFTAGASGWYGILIPNWIKSAPMCPTDQANYLLDASGSVLGDSGATAGFKPGHEVP